MDSMLHNIEIKGIDGHPEGATVAIDGKNVRARAYTVAHEAGCYPVINLNLVAIPTLSMDGKVRVSNKGDLAVCFDREEFDEFCQIWQEIQSEQKGVCDVEDAIEENVE